MKLPTTELSATKIRIPSNKHTNRMGASHHFFRFDKYASMSLSKSIRFFEDMIIDN